MSVFALPVFDRWLLHAPLLGLSALVNGAARRSLSEGSTDDTSAALRTMLCRKGIEPQPRSGPLVPHFLGLVTTRACNLNCVYCSFGASRRSETMSYSLAVAAVNWMAANAAASGRQTLDIHFFGGEPLIAFDVVEVAVHSTRAAAARHHLKPRLEVATNGTYSESRARFVGDHFQTVVLSIDGFEKTHNRRRHTDTERGSFQSVCRTARIVRDSPADLCLRICVADDNVDQLPELTGWFCEEFRPSTIDFETIQPTCASEHAGLASPDPYTFSRLYDAARETAQAHGVVPVYSASATENPRLTFCPVGNDALILHPEGRITACYLLENEWIDRGLDLNLGVLSIDGTIKLDAGAVERVRRLVNSKPRCGRCFCRWSCAGGCHVNNTYPSCSDSYSDFCLQTRLTTASHLLRGIDDGALVTELLKDRRAMERLALNPDDRLSMRAAYEN